ncbi:AMP-binding protein [Streptomyces argenteolus]|uniref:AMP-binding protein n=1 Tax=Streptomyces argenteolus TaxID=67274 RepID=A0ABW6X666_9ACTN
MSTQDDLARMLHLAGDDRTALLWRGRRTSYAALVHAADTLTDRLLAAGARGTHVMLLGPLCPAYVVGLLAALRSGAVPVPVDAGLTAGRYAWTERVARPSAVLSSDVSPAGHYRGVGDPDEVVLDAATGLAVADAAGPSGRPGPVRHTDPDAGYLIPTSGSTGEPKAVVGSRRGLHAFLRWFTEEFALTPADVCAAVTRTNFDPSLRELLAVLTAGGTLSLPDVDAQLDPEALARHLTAHGATTAFLVPSLARRIGDVLDGTSPDGLGHLRLGFFAGEVLPRRVVDQWTRLAPGAEFVNLYGMTEGTLAQLYRRGIRGTSGLAADGVPVGRPRPGTSVRIDEPGPDGSGEVVVTSSAPALGLLSGEPGPVPGTFRVTAFPAELRTGDTGRLDDAGELVVEGRRGNDLKVSGRRVSYHRFVDEVEGLPGVRQCAVVDRDGPHAFVAVADSAAPAVRTLAATVTHTARSLGLPRPAVHVRGDLPLLRSGKVDRTALAASAGQDAAAEAAGPAPHTGGSVEEQLRALLGYGTGTPSTTPFVDTGLTSLDMMEFVPELNRRFTTGLSVKDLFGLRDVAALAEAVGAARASAEDAPAAQDASAVPTPLPGRVPEGTYPLSERQLAYRALCMADGNADWCNISREIPVDRVLRPAAVQAAVDTLVARHDVLRLALTPDGTRQRHTEASAARCLVRQAPGAASRGAEHRARVQEARVRAVSELIDTGAAPPLRVVTVTGEDTTSVLLVAHHLFVDGLSLDLLARELGDLLHGRDLPGAPSASGYRDYCAATERRAVGDPADAAYWDGLLAGARQVVLPESTGEGATAGELLSRPFGVAATRAANRLATATGVSVFSVVLAAFELAVARTFGLGPLTVVVPVQIRHGAAAGTAGMFTSQLVVRGEGAATVAERAAQFAAQVEAGLAHSSREFDQRAEALGLAGTDCFPLSTVLFNQHPHRRGLRAGDLGDWAPRPLGRALRYQLQGELQMSGGEMALTYYYRRGITADRTDVVDRVHAHVLAALREAGRTPGEH